MELSLEQKIPGRKRRFGPFLLLVGFALFAVYGWLRFTDAIINWYWLQFAGLQPGPLYLAVTGALWGLAGLAALIGYLSGRYWGRIIGLVAAFFFAVSYWLDRLLIGQPSGSMPNTVFALFLTGAGLLFAIYMLDFADAVINKLRRWKKIEDEEL